MLAKYQYFAQIPKKSWTKPYKMYGSGPAFLWNMCKCLVFHQHFDGKLSAFYGGKNLQCTFPIRSRSLMRLGRERWQHGLVNYYGYARRCPIMAVLHFDKSTKVLIMMSLFFCFSPSTEQLSLSVWKSRSAVWCSWTLGHYQQNMGLLPTMCLIQGTGRMYFRYNTNKSWVLGQQ